ncbi:hypothetical protein pb186bvf_007454 [Paramecium bursaria]
MDQKECFRDQHSRINRHRMKEKRQIKEVREDQSLTMREAVKEVKEKCRRNFSNNPIGSAIQGNHTNKAKILFMGGDHDHIQNRQYTRVESKKIPKY